MNPVRSSLIVLQEPAFHREECPDGICHWCGHPLRFTEVATWHNRQRVRHKGDPAVELPTMLPVNQYVSSPCYKDCDREFRQSMVWNGQNAVRWKAWQEGLAKGAPGNKYFVWCVDCKATCEVGFVWVPKKRIGFATRQRKVYKRWNADHEIELCDGGEHSIENLRPRCCECHIRKTERERIRREDDVFAKAIDERRQAHIRD